MKRHLNLTIGKPCNENFETFQKTKKGGFCNVCTKEVIDFTQMKPREISNYFKKNNSINTCGRFKLKQLNQKSTSKKRARVFNFLSAVAVVCLSLFSFKTQAQNPITISDKDRTSSEDIANKKLISVKGTVITSEDGLPLPGANIILEGTTFGTQTNFDGYFEFPKKLKNGDVLIFSFVGLNSQKITIKGNDKLNIELEVNMESSEVILMGKVAVKGVYKSKKSN